MIKVSGYVLLALGVGHTIIGIVKYRRAIVAWIRDGFFNAATGHNDRLLAFWFLMFGAMLFLLGQITIYAVQTNDTYLLRVLGWYVVAIGVVGATALPRSPFWVAIVLALLMLWVIYMN